METASYDAHGFQDVGDFFAVFFTQVKGEMDGLDFKCFKVSLFGYIHIRPGKFDGAGYELINLFIK